jgi:tetratricopeptide (TPR) repeat protein
MISNQNSGYLTVTHRYSSKAQMAQGFALLAKDRELAMKILRSCHKSMIADASLADEFFPSLRKNRLIKEHDAWFEESWQAMMSIAKRFPQDDNIHNSAAWLASRCLRRLDDAEQQSKIALELRPNQAAYLDTMAEIWFARRDRAKAVEWSRKAITADPSQEPLKEQYFRFQSADFPQ